MKKYLVLMIIVAMATAAFAQPLPADFQPATGKWMMSADRLYQNDDAEKLAKINIKVPQTGKMVYEFNARYEGGAEDGHGGFGIHLFADTAHPGRSWGSGNSYLLWFNYDMNPTGTTIPKGFSAQLYRSLSHSKMELVQSVELNQYAHLVTPAVLANPIPIKLVVDSAQGEVRFYDPTNPNYYFYLNLGKDFPKTGQWVALRTNGLKVSFGMRR
jgi:hypothetical protein